MDDFQTVPCPNKAWLTTEYKIIKGIIQDISRFSSLFLKIESNNIWLINITFLLIILIDILLKNDTKVVVMFIDLLIDMTFKKLWYLADTNKIHAIRRSENILVE